MEGKALNGQKQSIRVRNSDYNIRNYYWLARVGWHISNPVCMNRLRLICGDWNSRNVFVLSDRGATAPKVNDGSDRLDPSRKQAQTADQPICQKRLLS